jgi:hypothetical protein
MPMPAARPILRGGFSGTLASAGGGARAWFDGGF